MNKAIELLSSYRKDIDAIQIAEILWLSQFMNINPSEPTTPTDSSEQNYTPAPSNNSDFEFKEMHYSISINSNKGTSKDSEEDFGFEGKNNASTYSVGFTNSNDFPNILKQFESLRFKEKKLDVTLLDEEKTADEIALVGFFHPIFQEVQNRENYFDLNIIVDKSKSMFLWKEHIKYFIKEIKLSPVFNHINIVHLNSSENEALFKDEKLNAIKFDAPLFKQDRRLTFIFTDVVGKAWRTNHMFSVIDTWSKYSFVSIVSMLPNHMWQKTPLRQGLNTFMKSTKALPKNRDLKLEYNFIERKLGSVNTKIPVISYDNSSFQNLSNVITAKKDSWIDARIFGELELKSLKDKEPLKISAEERVERFFASALPETRKLAIYCSVLPLHTRIIEKLIEKKSLGQGINAFVEFYFGGLIDRNVKTNNNQYEFYQGVRRELISYISVEGIESLFEDLNDVISKSLGLKTSIINLLYADSSELSNLGKKEKGIANLLVEILKEKGKYFKKQVDVLNNMIQKQSIEFSMIQVSEVNLEIGKNLVSVEEYNLFCEDTEREIDSLLEKGNQPIINISWDDAIAYCEWLSKKLGEKYRLPTRKEREYFYKKVDFLEDTNNHISEWCEEKIFWSSSEKKSYIGFRVLKEFKSTGEVPSSLSIEELQKIIAQDENKKLEFKAKWNQDIHELVKNIFSLANGSPKHIDETAYFIIGVDERDKNNFSLKRSDVSDIFSELEKLLKEYSEPEISNVLIEWYDLAEDNGVLVISIPPQGYLISLSKDLKLKNSTDKKGTTYYRIGENTIIASADIVIEFEKEYRKKLIVLYKEDDLDVDLLKIVEQLNKICNYLTFKIGEEPFELDDEVVNANLSYNQLEKKYSSFIKYNIRAIFFTKKPYDNNYFFEPRTDGKEDNLRIVSFADWEFLTTLSKNNGIVYFIAWLLALTSEKYARHYDSSECIYNFSGTKTDIDNNMRNPYICESCVDMTKDFFPDKRILDDLITIMDFVKKTSIEELENTRGKFLTSIPPINTNFIGRKDELKMIEKSLNSDNVVCVVNGIGGVGKSELSYRYLHEHKEKYNKIAFIEFTEESRSLEETFYFKFQDTFQLTEKDTLETIIKRLQGLKPKNLMVLDNLQSNEDFKKIQALSVNFDLLITTREKLDSPNILNLETLNIDNTKELFLSIYPTNENVDDILKYLDNHPLFIKLIAYSLKEGYMELDEVISTELPEIDSRNNKTFKEHLQRTFDRQFKSQSRDELKELLQILALFPAIEIDLNILEEILEKKRLKPKLQKLVNQGWLTRKENFYKLHQIIKLFILEEYSIKYEKVIYIFENIGSYLDPDNISYYQISNYTLLINSLLEFFKDKKSEPIANTYNILGMFYMKKGEYSKAEAPHKKSLEIYIEIFGENNIGTATSYSNLASLYSSKGEYDKAEVLYMKALKITERILGDSHPRTAISYNNLASLYGEKGEYDKAEALYTKALKIREKVLGEEHPDTATSYNNLALLYKYKGEYDKAGFFYEKSLKIREEVLGDNHLDTAVSYNNLGELYRVKGEYDIAESFYNKALKIRENILGEEHPDVALSYNNLALLYKSKGEYDKAEILYLKALKIREKVLGEEHPNTVVSYYNLSFLYQDIKQCSKAKEYLEKTITLVEKLEYPPISLIDLRRQLRDVEKSMAKEKKAKFNKRGRFCSDFIEKIDYWHMQLHPDNFSNYDVAKIKEILKEEYIGLDFGNLPNYTGDEPLPPWRNKISDYKRIFVDIKIGDIVVIRHGQKPIALVKVIGDYEFDANPTAPIWFRHKMKIEVLSYYDEYIKDSEVESFVMPSPRKAIERVKGKSTLTYEIINNWYLNYEMLGEKEDKLKISPSISLESSWLAHLEEEFNKPYMQELKSFLSNERELGKNILPRASLWFNALNTTPLDSVKVVILGQDPYPTVGHAHGLCFSALPEVKPLPKSLLNIYKELQTDLGIDNFHTPYLQPWAEQGVLLLNAVLTVEAGKSNAHAGRGWEQFTDKIIEVVNNNCQNVVFILWGSYAQKKGLSIDTSRHLVLKAPHPSPLSAYRGFWGSRPFSQINNYLLSVGKEGINWQL